MRKLLLLLLLCVLVAGGLYGWRHLPGGRGGPNDAQAQPPQTVSDAAVRSAPWQNRIKAFGQVRAVQGADLSAEVPGIVDQIEFRSGDEVRKGTVLLRLRLNDDTAKLQQLQATADLWAANLARDQKQFAVQAISRATLDQDTANLNAFRAQVAAQQALMSEKVVRAPFDGRLGLRQVDLGQYLVAGTPIVTLQSLDPIYVDFTVPQQQAAQVAPGEKVDVTVDAFTSRIFHAVVEAVDSRIDPSSRMVSVRASLGNADHALSPGMFAVVRLDEGHPHVALSVPTSAVSFNPYGNFVYVLTPKPNEPGRFVASSRVVKAGETLGNRAEILSGLDAGERVVTAGQNKLRNGSIVVIDNSVQPSDATDPVVREE
ncbi:efflux RND transporter periplasmic adaptor subunit [Rhizosaccharibacter radicis]|uniref:Efflux RND transporter periplasmic adaptor subunit n=1 Tax=Rhizosaccharibacter radicis TaxID=2782605 RepID=A0ABT1VVR1_9PROT|nr:efflux RND transporter periplasmic adaptor subunit [Acetobacteraceae bacterium KSS12]